MPINLILESALTELVCNFAVVRFLPYRETGEFVNIGVVVHAPEVGQFRHGLAIGKRNRRIRAFFPEFDLAIYKAAVDSLDNELIRQRTNFDLLLMGPAERVAGDGMTAFRTLLRRRESMLHFAEPGMRLGRPEDVLADLYSDYVERHFATHPDYQEALMRSTVSRQLRGWGLRERFRLNKGVGDDLFKLTLPFVHFDGLTPTAAIKPLDLDRPTATEIYDHGGTWIQRLRRLAERRHLPPRMVVPVRFPVDDYRRPIADDVARELTAIGATVLPLEDSDRLRELADV